MLCGLTFLTAQTSTALVGPKNLCAGAFAPAVEAHSWLPMKSLRVRTGCSFTQMIAWLKYRPHAFSTGG